MSSPKTKKSSTSAFRRNSIAAIIVGVIFWYIWLSGKPSHSPANQQTPSRETSQKSLSPKEKPPTEDRESTETLPSEVPSRENTSPETPPESEEAHLVEQTRASLSSSGTTKYENILLGYSFEIPRGAYYAGFGARDGASHSVAITTGTGVETWTGALVRVWYFPNTILPEFSEVEWSLYQNPATNMSYLKLSKGSLKVEGDPESRIVQTILGTAKRKEE